LQLFVVGFHGYTAGPQIINLIKDHYIGGIVLFTRNVESTQQLLQLISTLQRAAKDADHTHPLFIGMDQENGLVTRIKPPCAAQLPGAMAVSATGSIDWALAAAEATAATLLFYGVNTNYGPICDVNSEPSNPVIGVRSPGDDPEFVGAFATATAKGLRSKGIIPCAKHFPGHGDTNTDSHYALPVIRKSRAQLDACELVPFQQVLSQRVESVMTAHIALPCLGDELGLPTSLSPPALKVLREEMKYEGMVITDCLEMDGVRATYGTEKGAVMALRAGNDSVMICHTYDVQVASIALVIDAVKSGSLPGSRLHEASNRVRQLKTKFLSWDSALKMSSISHFEAMKTAQEKLAQKIYESSATIIRSDPGVLPLSSSGGTIVFLSPATDVKPSSAAGSGEIKTRTPFTPREFYSVLCAFHPCVVDVPFYENQALPLKEPAIRDAEVVVLATRNAHLYKYQEELGLKLAEMGKKLVVVSTCDPYDFLWDEEVRNLVAAYEPTVEAFAAAAKVIFGVVAASGRLPTRVKK
jgi:beta-N-acetylhexosaminidase